MYPHRVTFGDGAQTLYTRPIRDGSPLPISSATYRIVDLHRLETDPLYEIVTGEAAVFSSVSTTITADAGHRASETSLITVADATGLAVGRSYLLTSASLAREVVTVAAVSGLSVRLDKPVYGDFRSTSTLTGYEAAATFPSAQANDQQDFDGGRTLFAIDWTYGGAKTREVVQVVRTVAQCPVPASALIDWAPELSSRLGDSFSPEAYIAAAWRHVRAELGRHRIDADELYTEESLQQAVCYRAAQYIMRLQDGEMAAIIADEYKADHLRAMSGIVSGLAKPGDVVVASTGQAVATRERRGVLASR